MIVSLISVPLTLSYLGPEKYGIWITLSTLLAWFSLADLGLSNSLLPILSGELGKNKINEARDIVSTSLIGLTIISLVAAVLMMVIWKFINWNQLFNANNTSELNSSIAAGSLIVLASLPLSISNKIYIACQKGVIGNIWFGASSLATLFAILLVVNTEGDLFWLVVAFSGSQLLITLISAIWLFSKVVPELRPQPRFSLTSFKTIYGQGLFFFISQISTLLIFQTDNLIIAHFLGSEKVTPYSVTWRLFFYIIMVFQISSPYLWASISDANSKGDFQWIKNNFNKTLLYTLLIGAPILLFVSLNYEFIISSWAGSAAIPNAMLVYLVASFTLVTIILIPIVNVFAGMGKIKIYSSYTFITAITNIILSIILVNRIGINGVILATLISMILFTLLPTIFHLRKIPELKTPQ